MSAIEKRHNNLVKEVIDGNGRFYQVRPEPVPTKTCFDVVLKTFCKPSKEYLATVKIPESFPFQPPTLMIKNETIGQSIKLKFLKKQLWDPSMSIREALIETTNALSRRDMKPKRPTFEKILPSPKSSELRK